MWISLRTLYIHKTKMIDESARGIISEAFWGHFLCGHLWTQSWQVLRHVNDCSFFFSLDNDCWMMAHSEVQTNRWNWKFHFFFNETTNNNSVLGMLYFVFAEKIWKSFRFIEKWRCKKFWHIYLDYFYFLIRFQAPVFDKIVIFIYAKHENQLRMHEMTIWFGSYMPNMDCLM